MPTVWSYKTFSQLCFVFSKYLLHVSSWHKSSHPRNKKKKTWWFSYFLILTAILLFNISIFKGKRGKALLSLKKITKSFSYKVFDQFAFYFFPVVLFFKTGFLYATALTVTELALLKRLVSNSQRLEFDFNLTSFEKIVTLVTMTLHCLNSSSEERRLIQ